MVELSRWCEDLVLKKLSPQVGCAVLQAAENRDCRQLSRQVRQFVLSHGELALGSLGTVEELSEETLLSIIQAVCKCSTELQANHNINKKRKPL